MADIKVRIGLNIAVPSEMPSIDSNLTVYDGEAKVNNVSKLITSNTIENDGILGKSLALGYLSLSDGYIGGINTSLLNENGYNGYMFGATDINGAYELILSLATTDSSTFDSIIIYGDKTAQQFATVAVIDEGTENEKTIYSDDYIWAIKFESAETSHTIKFTTWNIPSYNASITYIAIMLNYLDFNKRWIKSIESLSQSTPDASGITYGVLGNSGSSEILDNNGEIKDYIEDGILDNDNLPLVVYANGKQVQAHITTDSFYSDEARTLSLDLQNELYKLDTLKYDGYDYPNESKSAYVMLYDVFYKLNGLTESEFDLMLDSSIVYGETTGLISDYLKAIIIKYPYLEKGKTYRETINKFCNLAQLQFIVSDSGQNKFVSARPVFESTNDIIVVPAKNQYSDFAKSVILKNKYDGVEITEKQITDILDYNVVIGTYSNTDITTTDEYAESKKTFIMYSLGNYYGYGAYVAQTLYYYISSFDIYKNTAQNLEQVKKLLYGVNGNGENNIKHTITYLNKTGTAFVFMETSTLNTEVSNANLGPINYHYTTENENTEDIILQTESVFVEGPDLTASVSMTDSTDIGTISFEDGIVDNGDRYTITFKILVGKKLLKLSATSADVQIGSGVYATAVTGPAEYLQPQKLEITVYGNKRIISFEDVSVNDVSNSKNVIGIATSNLLQENTKLSEVKMSTIITNNIVNDYSTGISNGKITIGCADYYDINGNKVKTWANGDILEVGDIIRIDKDNLGNSISKYADGTIRYWQITGRKFRNTGVPMIDLEYMETKHN